MEFQFPHTTPVKIKIGGRCKYNSYNISQDVVKYITTICVGCSAKPCTSTADVSVIIQRKVWDIIYET